MSTSKISKCDVVDNFVEEIGGLPIIDARGSNFDLDQLLKSPRHHAIYVWDKDTLGTPYKYGKVSTETGITLSFSISNTYGYQISYLTHNAAIPWMRGNKGGELSEWNTGCLPLTGGTLSSPDLYLGNGEGRLWGSNHTVSTQIWNTAGDSKAYRAMTIKDSEREPRIAHAYSVVDRINGADTYYALFGQHNKPAGSYTGNGTATSRTINIGGIGEALVINGNNWTTFVGINGAVSIASDGTVVGCKKTELNFHNGVLTIASTSNALNYNGETYWYASL